MSTNMEWQRQQVNERVRGAVQEGLAHQRLYRRRNGRSGLVAVTAALVLGAALFILAVTAAGCAPMESARAAESQHAPFMTMAERIAFQDRVWEASHPAESSEVDLTKLSPGDISAYRWIAMARFYARQLTVE